MHKLLLVSVLFLTACRPPVRQTVFIDPALSTLVPSDTVWLAGIRLDKFKTTPIYKQYFADRDLPGFDRFRKETGLDPRQDLWEFLIAGNGRDSVLLVRGKFSSDLGSEPRLNLPDAKRFSYKTYTLTGNDENAVTFMNSTVAVAGPTRLVKSIIDARDSGGLGLPKRLEALFKAIPKESQVWSAGDVGAGLERLNPRDDGTVGNLAQFGRMIEKGWFGVDFRTGMKLNAMVTCRSDDDARRLQSAMRALVGMGRLSTAPEQTDLLAAWDAVHTNVEQNRIVKVDADLNQAQTNAVIGAAQGKLNALPRSSGEGSRRRD